MATKRISPKEFVRLASKEIGSFLATLPPEERKARLAAAKLRVSRKGASRATISRNAGTAPIPLSASGLRGES